MDKLKKRWGLRSNWQVVKILLVFAITGYSSLFIAKPLLELIGLHQEDMNPWVYRPLRILFIFPIYNVLIIIIGWLFGEYRFFAAFVKKMLTRLGLGSLMKRYT